jgi:acyl-CoA thioesterase I
MNKTFYLFLSAILFFTSCKNTDEKTPAQVAPTAVLKTAVLKKNIVFFGNSLTAGYGLENVADGFVSLTQNRMDSLNLPYRCINAGLSGETTAAGAERVAWIIDQQPVDIFILELGGNDALRGINPEASFKNLQTIIDKVKIKHPSVKIVLAGMEAPRNMGKTYIAAFHDMYPTLAKKNNLPLIPFILDKVGGVKELNQADGIHPTAQGNKIIIETIWGILKPLL